MKQPTLPAAQPLGTWSQLPRLALKELRETLRDQRTLITLIGMPILLYPVLSIGFQRFFLASAALTTKTVLRVGLPNAEQAKLFTQLLALGESPDRDDSRSSSTSDASEMSDRDNSRDPTPAALATFPATDDVEFKLFEVDDLDAAVADGRIEVGLRIEPADATLDPERNLALDVAAVIRPDAPFGQRAVEELRHRFRSANVEFLEHRLAALGIAQRPRPIELSIRELDFPRLAQPVALSAVVPLILILMTITGAVYPAIDLTAGERERGTLEILLAAPVPRLRLLLAKYVAVLAVAVLTASVNLAMMTVTLWATGLGPMIFGSAASAPLTLIAGMGLLVLFAAFFSALLLCCTCFAHSFKEAQSYLIPVMLVSMAPGVMGVMPEITLNPATALVPLLNMVLLARDLLDGMVTPLPAVMTLLVTILYGATALAVASRVFGAEGVLYGNSGSWSDWWHRPTVVTNSPTTALATGYLVLLLPAFILTQNAIGQLPSASLLARLLLAGLATIVLFGVGPVALLAQRRIALRPALAWNSAPLTAYLAAILLGTTLWMIGHELVLLAHTAGLFHLSIERIDAIRQLLEQWRQLPLPAIVLALALAPAIGEEICFRGLLMGALLRHGGGTRAVLLSGVVFGLFHVIALEALALERLAPATLSGIVLGWIRYRTGSLKPGIVLHAINNGLLVTLAYHEPWLKRNGWDIGDTNHLPFAALLTACLALLVAIALVEYPARRRQPEG